MTRRQQWIFLVWGFAGWILGAIAFQFTGPVSGSTALAALYVGTPPLTALLLLPFYSSYGLYGVDRASAGILLCAPGMVFDTASLFFFETAYAGVAPAEVTRTASWLVWVYASILVLSLVPGRASASA